MKRTELKRKTPMKRGGPLPSGAPLRATGPGLKRTPLAGRSAAKQDEASALRLVYAAIGREREPICAGCGRHQGGAIKLSHSHLVPRAENQALICEADNIAYHCLDWMGHIGCHTLWESNAKRHTLLDYKQNMAFVAMADPRYYAQLVLNTVTSG